jgi:hypothetical protein
MLDRDLAELFGVETKRLNEQVKRNIERFPLEFRFQITRLERNNLVASCDRLSSLKFSTVDPYVYTEQGVAMLSSVLSSKTAILVSIQIMKAFVAIRKFMIENASVFLRLDRIELKLLESENMFDKIFKVLDSNKLAPIQGIFFDGQILDAYKFVSDLIRSAKQSITLIDNYINNSTLSILSKKEKDIKERILTKK